MNQSDSSERIVCFAFVRLLYIEEVLGLMRNAAEEVKRKDLRCLCIKSEIWNMAVELADEASTSVSAVLRQLIKKAYQRNKKSLIDNTG